MENSLKRYAKLYPMTWIIALFGVGGSVLEFVTPSYIPYETYPDLFPDPTPYLFGSILLSAILMVLCLVMVLFSRGLGGGRKRMTGYLVVGILLLAVQILLYVYVMLMQGSRPEFIRVSSRRMYLGYLECTCLPFFMPKVKQAILTGGGQFGQSLADRSRDHF